MCSWLLHHQRQRQRICDAPSHTHARTFSCTPFRTPPQHTRSTREQQRERAPPTPHFDAVVARARHDPRAVRREAHGIHPVAVCAWLLRHQRHIRRICATHHAGAQAPSATAHCTFAATASIRQHSASERRSPQTVTLPPAEPLRRTCSLTLAYCHQQTSRSVARHLSAVTSFLGVR